MDGGEAGQAPKGHSSVSKEQRALPQVSPNWLEAARHCFVTLQAKPLSLLPLAFAGSPASPNSHSPLCFPRPPSRHSRRKKWGWAGPTFCLSLMRIQQSADPTQSGGRITFTAAASTAHSRRSTASSSFNRNHQARLSTEQSHRSTAAVKGARNGLGELL